MPDFPPPPIGITKLSELIIDVHKDWGAYRIANTGIPIIIGDALRKGTRLTMDEMPDEESDHFLVAQGIGVNPSYRLLNPIDIPNLDTSKIITGILATERGGLGKALVPTWENDYILVYKTATGDWRMELKAIGISKLSELIIDTRLTMDGLPDGEPDRFLVAQGIGVNPSYRPLTTVDIPNLDASKIITGVFSTDRIPDLDASKIVSGILALARIPDLPTSKITSGRFPMSRMPDGALGQYIRGSGAGVDPVYAIVKLSEISIDVAKDWGGYRIANIGAPTTVGDALRKGTRITMDEITDGISDYFLVAQGSGVNPAYRLLATTDIPSLDVSKITTGRFPLSRMPSGSSGYFLKGQGAGVDPIYALLVAGDIPSLDASKITSGRFPMNRMPDGTSGLVLCAKGSGVSPAYDHYIHASRHIDGGADEITSKLDFRAMNLLLAGASATTTFSTTSTSPVDVTGLACSITLPVTASVLVFCSVFEYYNNTVNKANYQRIMRGTTSLRLTSTGVYNSANERYDSLIQCHDWQVASGTYTYKLQGYVNGGTGYWGMASLPSHGVINAIASVW